jgi:DNA gyrase subunit B
MNAEQLWETTMDPSFRTLRQVTIDSLPEADRVFSMLMGDDRLEENLLRKRYLRKY